MRALRIHAAGDLRLDDVETPRVAPGEVLVEPVYVGICGSDLHYLADGAAGVFRISEPLIPGHEMSGRLVDDPSGTYEPGQPIVLHPATWGPGGRPELGPIRHTWPGGSYLGSASTTPHTQGAMAERLVARVDQVRPLPPGLPLRRAALAEPLAVALHAIAVSRGVGDRRVLVSGAGPIGLLTAIAAMDAGAREVWCADVRQEPLARASGLGVDGVLNVSEEPLPMSGFDVAFECAGVPQSLHGLLLATRAGGVVVQVGNVPDGDRPVNLAPIVSKELQLRGTFRFDTEIDDAVRLLDRLPVLDGVITHDLDLADAAAAFAIAGDPSASGKVLVRP